MNHLAVPQATPEMPGSRPPRATRRSALVLAALLVPAFATRATELSIDQVKAALRDAPASLAGKDLSDLDLGGFDLHGADLRGTSFFGGKLVQTDLRGAKLQGATLNGAWLMGTDFTEADLSQASLLSLVILGGTVKKMPVFRRANLTGVRLIADLPGADLSGANLTGLKAAVNLKNQGMGQMRTDLTGANLEAVTAPGADFGRSLMRFARLRGADLRGANFFGVKLEGADLTGADVTGADFTEADLDGTIFRDAKGFDQARGLDRAAHFDKVLR